MLHELNEKNGSYMKVAVLMDFMQTRGGGERTMLYLAQRYDADIYTSRVVWDKILPELKNYKVSVLENVPRVPFLMQEAMLRGFRNLDLSAYDAAICLGTGYAYFTAEKNHPTIWYSFGVSPVFYKNGPEANKHWLLGKAYYRPAVWLWKERIQQYDRYVMTNKVDAIVAMTKWNADMVKDYYGRNATRIIFPPIETKKLYNKQSRGYYLMVASLFPEARIDLVIKAFKKIPDKTLYIEGIGPAESYLKKIAGDSKNIKFLGRGNTSELRELYAKCIALLDVGYYRGFSMVMGEALASGKPCIAVNQGAYPEMIANNKTGAIVNPTVEGVIDGVSRITPDVAADMKKACLAKAKQFDLKSFYSGWDAVLKEAKNKVK